MRDPVIDSAQLTVEELLERLSSPNDVFLLDVRNRDEFDAWRIETCHTPETLNIPYFEFLEYEEDSIAQIPRDRDIVAVCAHGGSSDFVASRLAEEGIRAVNVAGGMIAWGNFYHFRTIVETVAFQIYQVDRVSRGCLSYIFISRDEAFIIDPLRHTEKYEAFLQTKGATLKLVLDTHAHADHISGGPALTESTGAPYYLHPYDGIHPFDILPPKIDYEMLKDGAEFTVGEFKIDCIHTPGHTLGQVSFLITAPDSQQYFASGDTLFLESFGRPDLGGQGERWAPIVYETIHETICSRIPHDAYLIPGHYAQASEMKSNGLFMQRMGELWTENSALQLTEREVFIDYVLGHLPTLPPQYVDIKRVNAGLLHPDEETASELELGKNICALSEAYE